MSHTHQCSTCQKDYPCPGELRRNVDGEPTVICSLRHDVSDPITECQVCYAAEKCAWCGHQGVLHDTEAGDRMHRTCLRAAGQRERQDQRSA